MRAFCALGTLMVALGAAVQRQGRGSSIVVTIVVIVVPVVVVVVPVVVVDFSSGCPKKVWMDIQTRRTVTRRKLDSHTKRVTVTIISGTD